MSSISTEPLDAVLKRYSLDYSGIRNESYKDKKGVWWVKTIDGNKVLKKISNSEETLTYILDAIRYLKGKGINIPDICKTKEDREYAKIDESCFVLSDAIIGKNPSYNSQQELAIIVKELARFHSAASGFFPGPGSKPKIHLGTWIEEYQQQVDDMTVFYNNEIISKSNDMVGEVVVKEFPYFCDRAAKAIEGLKGNEYKEWVQKAGTKGCLCHQDFAAGNLILDQTGKLFILDTDSLTIDIPARDLRKLLNKVMKKAGRWDRDIAKEIFCCYQSVNPLTASEWHVVKLDIMFPHLFIGAMSKYYYKRDKEWSIAKYLERIKEMAVFEKSIVPILENYEYLIPINS